MPLGLEVRQHLAQQGRSREVLLARGDHEEERPLVDPAGEEAHEAHAEVVRPMQVLQHQERRPGGGQGLEELGHRLEEPHDVLGALGGAGRSEMREHAAELAPEPHGQAVGRLDETTALADRVDPRAERQHLLGLVRAAGEHPPAVARRERGDLGDQAALADPGLAGERDGPAAACGGRLPGLVELGAL